MKSYTDLIWTTYREHFYPVELQDSQIIPDTTFNLNEVVSIGNSNEGLLKTGIECFLFTRFNSFNFFKGSYKGEEYVLCSFPRKEEGAKENIVAVKLKKDDSSKEGSFEMIHYDSCPKKDKDSELISISSDFSFTPVAFAAYVAKHIYNQKINVNAIKKMSDRGLFETAKVDAPSFLDRNHASSLNEFQMALKKAVSEANKTEISFSENLGVLLLDDFGEFLKEFVFKENITGLLNPKMNTKDNFQFNGAIPEVLIKNIAYPENELFKEKEKKTAPKMNKKTLEDYKKEDFKVYSDEEISKLPLNLKLLHQEALQEYMNCKDFYTIEDYRRIEGLKTGLMSSMCFIGPAGTGKTTLLRSYAGALNMPFVLVGGSGNVEESALFGHQTLVNSKEGTGTVMEWRDGPLTTALRYGAFVLFDEENAVSPGVLMKLNSILDNSKAITLDNGEVVKVNPKMIYTAAMNIGAGYEGTNKSNMSHMDRFSRIYKIRPKKAKEMAEIVAKRTGYTNETHLINMCSIVENIYKKIFANEDVDGSEVITSIRRVIEWVNYAKQTGEFLESSTVTLLSHLAIYADDINDFETYSFAKTENVFVSETFNQIKEAFLSEYFDYSSLNGEKTDSNVQSVETKTKGRGRPRKLSV